jgi:hypothetical protein
LHTSIVLILHKFVYQTQNKQTTKGIGGLLLIKKVNLKDNNGDVGSFEECWKFINHVEVEY